MQLIALYPTLTLDSISNAANFFSGKWNPDLKRNQSQQLLTLLLSKFYFPYRSDLAKGNPFHAKVQASHEALAASLNLSREWVCKLVARLRAARWIETEAPRRPDGKLQEITIFRPGGKLKKLLVMLLKSSQRSQHRVKTSSQEVLTSKISQAEVAKNLLFLRGLRESLGKKLGMKT